MEYGHPPIENFVAVQTFEATYHDAVGELRLVVELRQNVKGHLSLFTKLRGQEIRVKSIQEFVKSQPDCISLSIPHHVHIQWKDKLQPAHLIEIYSPTFGSHPFTWCNLKLIIDKTSYETEECDSLTEAWWELHEMTQQEDKSWRLITCYDCFFAQAGYLFFGHDERDQLRCYRDAPAEVAEEVNENPKHAHKEALESGAYFVNAFHTCAAWEPRRAPSYMKPVDS